MKYERRTRGQGDGETRGCLSRVLVLFSASPCRRVSASVVPPSSFRLHHLVPAAPRKAHIAGRRRSRLAIACFSTQKRPVLVTSDSRCLMLLDIRHRLDRVFLFSGPEFRSEYSDCGQS